jgi:hypothetical protein
MPAPATNRARANEETKHMTNTNTHEESKPAKGGPVIGRLKLQEEDPARREAILGKFFSEQRERRTERLAAVEAAEPALERLCRNVLTQRSGQCYRVRDLLYSLYNGQATSLLEIVSLDWELRKDLCAVFLAFGFEDSEFAPTEGGASVTQGDRDFYYAAMKKAITAAGQWDWFCEAHKDEEEA